MRLLLTTLGLFVFLLTHAQIRSLEVEPNHSTVGFRLSIAGFSAITGKFSDYNIYLDWNDTDFAASSITAEIKVNSINTGIPDRDTHLQSADFFDVEQFPLIRFTSDSLRRINYANYAAYGQLSMHGVTKSVVLPFEIVNIDGNTIGFKLRTKLNRMDYGVGSDFAHTDMPEFLAKEVEVEIDFWTRRRKN